MRIIGSLSRDVFERRTSTGSELFSLLVCLDANKFVLLSFFSPLKTIYSRVSTKPLPNDAKSSLPVDVRRSKTLLLKLLTNEGEGKLALFSNILLTPLSSYTSTINLVSLFSIIFPHRPHTDPTDMALMYSVLIRCALHY